MRILGNWHAPPVFMKLDERPRLEVFTLWQADHIVPIAEGGGECGLDGLRTLCTCCHKRETRALARRRAERRRQQQSGRR